MTFSWPRLTWPAWDARQAGPRWRKMSATSTAGRDNGGALRGVFTSLSRRSSGLVTSSTELFGAENNGQAARLAGRRGFLGKIAALQRDLEEESHGTGSGDDGRCRRSDRRQRSW